MRRKVYYLDDEEDLRDIFVNMYASETVEVETFATAESLLNRCTQAPPDIFFLDYRLPQSSGVAVARKLPANIPKVLVTGEIDVKHGGLFLRVLQKPWVHSELLELIQSATPRP